MKKKILIPCIACVVLLLGAITAFAAQDNIPVDNTTNIVINTPSTEISIATEEAGLAATSEIKTEIAEADKSGIWHKMLNSIDYYDSVSGTVVMSEDTVSTASVMNFQSNLETSDAYIHWLVTPASLNYKSKNAIDSSYQALVTYDKNSSYFDRQSFSHDLTYTEVDNINKMYKEEPYRVITRNNVSTINDENRITIEPDGMPCYHYRTNPTNIPAVSSCLFPQEIAFGFLASACNYQAEV
jgi:hypothetical protein